MGAGHIWLLLILLVVALVMFGPNRLPEIGASIGNALRGFKRELLGDDQDGNGGQ